MLKLDIIYDSHLYPFLFFLLEYVICSASATFAFHLVFQTNLWATVWRKNSSVFIYGSWVSKKQDMAQICIPMFCYIYRAFTTLCLERQRACSYSPGMSLYEGWVPSALEGAAVIRWWENGLSIPTHLLSISDALSGTRVMPGQVLLMSASFEETMRCANTQLFVCTWWKRCGFHKWTTLGVCKAHTMHKSTYCVCLPQQM